jgi:hypothetical protein
MLARGGSVARRGAVAERRSVARAAAAAQAGAIGAAGLEIGVERPDQHVLAAAIAAGGEDLEPQVTLPIEAEREADLRQCAPELERFWRLSN